MKTSDNEVAFTVCYGKQITSPLTCVRCEGIIPMRPTNMDTAKAFTEGNFLHDEIDGIKTWRECNPRHAKNCV